MNLAGRIVIEYRQLYYYILRLFKANRLVLEDHPLSYLIASSRVRLVVVCGQPHPPHTTPYPYLGKIGRPCVGQQVSTSVLGIYESRTSDAVLCCADCVF